MAYPLAWDQEKYRKEHRGKTMVNLFDSFSIGDLKLKNRFMRSATWDNTADSAGAVTDTSLALYSELGRGGIGLIVTGFAFVAPSGQAMPHQYGIFSDELIPGLHKLVQTVHQGGAKIAVQIVHSGLQSIYLPEVGKECLAVSAIPDGENPHREMTDGEIEGIIDDFAAAALRARKAGFDAVQLHGAHGYLMSQFLSPHFNRRTDKWGGSAENRQRFHLEIVRRVRQEVGDDFPVILKLGVRDDNFEDGLTLEDGLETARQMVAEGVEFIEVSAGAGYPWAAPIPKKGEPVTRPFVERAAAVKKTVKVPVAAVGGIRTLETAQEIVASGQADMISMCRPFIREPGIIERWRMKGLEPAKCISCHQCNPDDENGPIRCKVEAVLLRKKYGLE
jgi:2,4-dienoyl-CoA reductase-like NADH-dependent reductase (Old Yellow Enzyme family)